ncbi:MFS transporter [Actinoplanes sp. NPDC051851]|uniref:MFS transporter n=1 Tax=Actinoplanes sp. NPDC051851 TaxID=3154753 RepID=UPI0034298630
MTRHGTRGVLISMCFALVLVVASVSALNLGLPDLAVGLNASNGELTWIADGYTVALAALVLPIGALGDRYGRRNVLVIGTAVFALASAAAALTDAAGALIGWRVLMGVGAAMIMPGTLSTITAVVPADKRGKAVATWSGFAAAGSILGMLIAGALLERWGWESIFWVTALAAVIAGGLAAFLAPDTREEEHHGRFDIAGALTTCVAVGSLVYAIIEGNETGWTDTPVLIALALFVAGLIAYVALSLRNPNPLLDPRLFTLRGFTTGSLTVVVQFMAVFGFFFVGLQYLQLILGYSPLHSAVALIPVAAVVLPTSQITTRLVPRFGPRAVMTTGLLLLAAGMAWISRLDTASGYLPFLAGLILAGLGMGLTSTTGTDAIVSSLSRDKQGVASAMNDTTREVGSAIGIALMGSVYGSHYRDSLNDLPGALPTTAVDTIKESAAAGLVVAQQAGALADTITAAVEKAFMDGLSASLIVVATVLTVAAVIVLVRAPGTAIDRDEAPAPPAGTRRRSP